MRCASGAGMPMARATSLMTLRALRFWNVAIWPTLSLPYFSATYAMTSSRRDMQKSTSKSGMLTRSGFKKRSNRSPYGIGSSSVMPSEYATSEPAPEPRPGPTGNAARLRLADEVPDDQEVARVLHARDHVELELEPLAVRALVDRLSDAPELGEARLEPVARHVAEVAVGVVALGHRELRQHRLAEVELQPRAHLGDPERVRERLRNGAERLRHLLRALQVHLRASVVERRRFGVGASEAHALEVDLRDAVVLLREVHVVRRDERQREILRRLDEHLVHDALLRKAVILELHEHVPRLERVAQLGERLTRAEAARARAHAAERVRPGSR